LECVRPEVCLDGVCTLPCSGVGLEALFVVGDETLTAADLVVSDWLQTTLGFTVTILAAGATLYDASSAAGRRVGTFLGDTTATELTEDGERLILAAFYWTAGLYP
jgi:hypothetical protein